MSASVSVERVPRIGLEELEHEFFDKDRPVVLTESLATLPIAKEWSLRHFQAQHGDTEVIVRGGCRMVWKPLTRVSIRTYLDWVFGEGDLASNPVTELASMNPYAAYNRVDLGEIDFSPWVPKHYARTRPSLWMGPTGAMTPLHSDELGVNIFFQFEGRKRFVVFPTEQESYVYPSDIFDYGSRFSRVNLDAPDLGRFPLYERATPITIDLEPGEVLVLPRDWFHEVHTLERSLSLNIWIERRDRRARDIKWNLRGFGHLLGIYKRNKCLCHILDQTPQDWAAFGPVVRSLLKLRMRGHGRDLADMLEWKRIEPHAPQDHV